MGAIKSTIYCAITSRDLDEMANIARTKEQLATLGNDLKIKEWTIDADNDILFYVDQERAKRVKRIPKWTVLVNVPSEETDGYFHGTMWMFFDSETQASLFYENCIERGMTPCKRPFHPSDIIHLCAAHRNDTEKF